MCCLFPKMCRNVPIILKMETQHMFPSLSVKRVTPASQCAFLLLGVPVVSMARWRNMGCRRAFAKETTGCHWRLPFLESEFNPLKKNNDNVFFNVFFFFFLSKQANLRANLGAGFYLSIWPNFRLMLHWNKLTLFRFWRKLWRQSVIHVVLIV